MTRDEQKIFIAELTANLRKGITAQIDKGLIPEEWDGFELRALLAEHAARFTYVKMNPSRKRDYNNTVIINNL